MSKKPALLQIRWNGCVLQHYNSTSVTRKQVNQPNNDYSDEYMTGSFNYVSFRNFESLKYFWTLAQPCIRINKHEHNVYKKYIYFVGVEKQGQH